MNSIKQYIIAKIISGRFRTKVEIVISLLFTFTLLLANYMNISFAQGSKIRQISSMDEFEDLISSPSYSDRSFAAANVASIPDLDEKKAAEILVQGIILELEHPSTLNSHPNSYLTDSERLIGMMVYSLADLGSPVNELLRSYVNSLSGYTVDWIIVVLGLQEDELAHRDLDRIMLNNDDPNLRSMAARALYENADSTDIPYLLEALKDEYYVSLPRNEENLPENELTIWYPVREDAASVLRKLGYSVSLVRHEVILKEPGEWDETQRQQR